jgi:hypothetical protein
MQRCGEIHGNAAMVALRRRSRSAGTWRIAGLIQLADLDKMPQRS